MESTYVKIIKEVCSEENIELSCFSSDWVLMLKKEDKLRYILAYQFDLNTAAAQAICKDKCAAYDVLSYYDTPCVEHSLFMSAATGYSPKSGNYKYMYEMLSKYKKIVVKPNEGASGTNVYAVSNGSELESAVDKIFKTAQSLAISPYYEIKKEFRVIVLNGEVKLVFSKEIPFVEGDGCLALGELISKSPHGTLPEELGPINLSHVLKKGEIWKLGWKHNLAHGALPHRVTDDTLIKDLSKLAIKAADILNIKFASIDIIRTEADYKILEVNSGVMMEYFAASSDSNYEIAKKIYKEATLLMFS
ncbi:MAG: hypothetical protein FWE24_11260 [Defluviitaleaceae bacterium]|nr:hypothetical protein [Defluviitaleaceae bacterium]